MDRDSGPGHLKAMRPSGQPPAPPSGVMSGPVTHDTKPREGQAQEALIEIALSLDPESRTAQL